jgi:hypothetical protein
MAIPSSWILSNDIYIDQVGDSLDLDIVQDGQQRDRNVFYRRHSGG